MPNRLVSSVIRSQRFDAVSSSASVREVARLMKKNHVSAVLVVGRKKELLGLCAERDVIEGVVATGLDPDKTPVATVMTQHPQTITPDKPFGHALHIMHEGEFRHVPVVDGSGRPLGMLCSRDALRLDALQFGSELIQREEIADIL
jgi:CBS domain-containing protein